MMLNILSWSRQTAILLIFLCLFFIFFDYNQIILTPFSNNLIKPDRALLTPPLVTTTENSSANNTTKAKRILFWQDDYSEPDKPFWCFGGLGPDVFKQSGCPTWQCELYDRYRLKANISEEEYDAIIFHDPTWPDKTNNVPVKRSYHQKYIFYTRESPGFHRDVTGYNHLKGFFNWTMTYRWDSDIVFPYGVIEKMEDSTQNMSLENYAKGKTKMAAWFVSNCASVGGRNEYARLLQNYVDVDVYGRCGNLSCPRSDEDACRRMLNEDYKFYLSFENSNCLDYVTEKLIETLHYRVIPIVMDLNGNYGRFAPPGSYINALDFPSVEALANYMKKLDQNDTLYNSYHSWRGHYRIRNSRDDDRTNLCSLCSLLHRGDSDRVYYNLTDWWVSKSSCKNVVFKNNNDTYWAAENVPLNDALTLY